jgi:hypothetical protein
MPFKSKAQRRKFYAMYQRGEITKAKLDEWERATTGKTLPERARSKTNAKKTRKKVKKKTTRSKKKT